MPQLPRDQIIVWILDPRGPNRRERRNQLPLALEGYPILGDTLDIVEIQDMPVLLGVAMSGEPEQPLRTKPGEVANEVVAVGGSERENGPATGQGIRGN